MEILQSIGAEVYERLDLAFLGLLATIGYFAISIAKEYLERKLVSSVTISNIDPVYDWVNKYLMERGYLTVDSMADCEVRMFRKKFNNYAEFFLALSKPKEKP